MPPQLAASQEGPDQISCDCLVLPAFDDGGPRLIDAAGPVDDALDGHLSEHLSNGGFRGRVGDVAVVPTLGRLPAQSVAVAGLGKRNGVNATSIRRAAGSVARRLSDQATIASALHLAVEDSAGPAAEGFLLGSYRYTRFKSDPRPSKIQRVLFVGGADQDAIARAEIVSDATNLARDLVNEPAGSLSPDALARKAQEIADVGGLGCTIRDKEMLIRDGFGGVLGVAQGSLQEPRFIELRYEPDSPFGKIVLVGKGITFDSGGLSLKDAKNMETMKTDMAGGAAVLGAMAAIARMRPSVSVVGLVPATENMPGGGAIKPGDVITHYGGRTSEVLNTDAEGRLVLADALAYACELEPDAVIDVATLTGGIMVALGKTSSGLFSNDEALRDEIEAAAERAGERVWRMPLYKDYRSEMDSEIADIKNTGSRWGSAIFGALFLHDFVPESVPWAHLDIAGAARADSDHDEVTKGGTGVATRTLISFVEARSE